ncbi:hypothetical protein EIN_177620 [Entamoeba invadens IP1]|uniref:hypothetical protein n=1 Tax=Entamoeba invadens IP1 TaxID=370355 RepID=UPI0002C3F2A1|nr:hypothetical protein EIN_177620 [Entamoeba invadens IP1]ELP93875.1 hypothetical protein EIN_177620 [Entamoeba invadens IP1]|eukprot:XP_004260646.1 hypothetical protein EIN_177620 [Entamoeba invadens IP1]
MSPFFFFNDGLQNINKESPQKQTKYCTKPCVFFMQNGYCKKGENCTFSHDISAFMESHSSPPQKQFVSVDKLYRTKPCKYFFETGTCRKGKHCNFSHDLSLRDEYLKGNYY